MGHQSVVGAAEESVSCVGSFSLKKFKNFWKAVGPYFSVPAVYDFQSEVYHIHKAAMSEWVPSIR